MSQFYSNLEPYDAVWVDGIYCQNCGRPAKRYFYRTQIGPSFVDVCHMCHSEEIGFQ